MILFQRVMNADSHDKIIIDIQGLYQKYTLIFFKEACRTTSFFNLDGGG